jgi:hypothetical protein
MTTIPQNTTPHQPVTALFPDSVLLDKALGAMRLRALAAYPLERVRIERGFQLALTGKVELLPDGTALVQSQTWPDVRYAVKRTCPCNDATRAPGSHCKHVWARALYKKAQEALADAIHEPYYRHTDAQRRTVLLGHKTLADTQRAADGHLAATVCGYPSHAV